MVARRIECVPLVDAAGRVIDAIWWLDLFETPADRARPPRTSRGGHGRRPGDPSGAAHYGTAQAAHAGRGPDHPRTDHGTLRRLRVRAVLPLGELQGQPHPRLSRRLGSSVHRRLRRGSPAARHGREPSSAQGPADVDVLPHELRHRRGRRLRGHRRVPPIAHATASRSSLRPSTTPCPTACAISRKVELLSGCARSPSSTSS